MARSVSSNPLYASIESRGIDDRDFDNEDDRPVRDYATELKRDVDEDDADDDDYDADPGYTTVGSESASSLGPFLPRQRLLTPPSPLREDDDDFDENDDVDDNEDASRSETHVKKGIDQPGIRRKKTDPSLNSPANSQPPLVSSTSCWTLVGVIHLRNRRNLACFIGPQMYLICLALLIPT